MFPFTHFLTRFKAGQAAEITGRSMESQRNDVRAGATPTSEVIGNKRLYDAYGLAELLVVEALADWGIGPTESIAVAREVGPRIANWALSREGAVGGESHRAAFVEFCRKHGVTPGKLYVTEDDEVIPVFRFCILWPQGEVEFIDDLTKAFDADRLRTLGIGAAVILDVHEMGQVLFEQAGPLGWPGEMYSDEELKKLSEVIEKAPDYLKS